MPWLFAHLRSRLDRSRLARWRPDHSFRHERGGRGGGRDRLRRKLGRFRLAQWNHDRHGRRLGRGRHCLVDKSPPHGFLFENGIVKDLNSLLLTHDLHVAEAVSIGPGGSIIAGRALAGDGTQHAVLLVRPDAPTAAAGTSELPASQIFADGQRANALALDDTNVYWVNQTGVDSDATWELRTMPKAGGQFQLLANGARYSADLAAGATNLYLTVAPCVPGRCGSASGFLFLVPKAGRATPEQRLRANGGG